MRKTITFIIALAMLLSCFTVFAATADSAVENRQETIYKVDTAPVIDGVIDADEYPLLAEWPEDTMMTAQGDYVENIEAYVYMCYDNDYLYYAVKTECDAPHAAVMDNTSERYIFNAHHLMTMIIPDNPTNGVYPGAEDYNWNTISSGGYCYEWTMIYTSEKVSGGHEANVSYAANHFGSLIGTKNVSYACSSDQEWDVYEIRIPWTAMKSNKQKTALTATKGTVFGFDFAIGLTDIGTGYDTDDRGNYLYFAECYAAEDAKALNLCATIVLGGYEDGTEEPSEEPSEEQSEVVIDWEPAGEKDFPIMLVDDESFEGTTVLHTTGTFTYAWRDYALLQYVGDDTYKVVSKCASSGDAPSVEIEEGYILVAANTGNDWPALFANATGSEWYYGDSSGQGVPYSECPNFATSLSTKNSKFITSMKVGEEYKLVGYINEQAYLNKPIDENYYYATDIENCQFYTYLTKVAVPEESKEESKETSKTEEKSKEESKEESKIAEESSVAEESKTPEESSVVEESETATEEKSPVIWIVIGAVALAVIAVVIVIIVKKKK